MLIRPVIFAAIVSSLSAGIAGCSEPARCQAPTALAFDGADVADGDAIAPGLQSDIHLTSTLSAGELVEMVIAADDGTPLASMSAPADADGNVTFHAVSMPPPHVVLTATANATCGIGRAELAVAVGGGSACELSLAPSPETNAYYAPMGVLSSLSDPDDATPGYQATVQVATLPGWTAEIFETPGASGSPAGTSSVPTDVSIGKITAAANGVATEAVTVADGELGFYAVCRGPGASEVSSPATMVIADTTPPACGLTMPRAGSTITQRYDTDAVAPGWQLPLAVHADGSDVEGEPIALLAGPSGGVASALDLPAADARGNATSTMTIPAARGTWDVALTMRDHAGNLCTTTQTFDVEPNACDATATATVTTADADPVRGGVQATIAVQVAAARTVKTTCSQQRVSVSCGIDNPTTFTDSNGRNTLQPTVCTKSPCTVQRMCTLDAEGVLAGGATVHTKTSFVVDFNDTP